MDTFEGQIDADWLTSIAANDLLIMSHNGGRAIHSDLNLPFLGYLQHVPFVTERLSEQKVFGYMLKQPDDAVDLAFGEDAYMTTLGDLLEASQRLLKQHVSLDTLEDRLDRWRQNNEVLLNRQLGSLTVRARRRSAVVSSIPFFFPTRSVQDMRDLATI